MSRAINAARTAEAAENTRSAEERTIKAFGRAKSAPPRLKDAFFLAFLSSLGPFAAGAYLPSFRMIAEELGGSMLAVQQSLTIYLVAFAVSCLFVGAISDAFGRRRVIIGGTLLFAVASVGAMFAGSLETLWFWRGVQGVCASVGPVVTQAVVRDRWEGTDAAKLLSLMAVLFALSPALSPVVGGWIAIHAGWRMIFLFLAVFNLGICLSAALGLKESLPPEKRRAFAPGAVLGPYGRALRHKAFMAGVVGHGFCFLGAIVYTAGSADFVLNIIGMQPDQFAWYMFPIIAATMTGAWLSPRLAAHTSPKKLVLGAAVVMAVTGLTTAWIERDAALPYPWILSTPIIYSFCMSLVRPVMNVMNLDYFPQARGTAASIQQFCQTMAFASSSALLVPLILGWVSGYSLVTAGSGLCVLGLWAIVFSERRRLGFKDERF